MKSTSEVIIGATLVMGVSIVILLGLVLVLLTELCCSLLPSRRRHRNTKPNATTDSDSSPPTRAQEQAASPLSSFYAQGVLLDAPRSSLFSAVSSKENEEEMKNQSFQFYHGLVDILTQEPNTSPHCLGVISPSSPSTSIINLPQPFQETPTQVGSNSADKDKACGGVGGEHFVDISNTINENDVSRLSREDTPFETPETSPSRLESGDCSSGDEGEKAQPISTI